MKTLFLLFFIAASAVFSISAQTAELEPGDLRLIEGAEWVGTLTYLDYRSNKKTSIKSNLRVTPGSNDRSWQFEYVYPDEPKANSRSEVKLASDGRALADQIVVETAKLPGGILRIVTTKEGTDNTKKAMFRYTYLVGRAAFSIKKEVMVEGAEEYFERNEYSWTR